MRTTESDKFLTEVYAGAISRAWDTGDIIVRERVAVRIIGHRPLAERSALVRRVLAEVSDMGSLSDRLVAS